MTTEFIKTTKEAERKREIQKSNDSEDYWDKNTEVK